MFASIDVISESCVNEIIIKCEIRRVFVISIKDIIDHPFAAPAEVFIHIAFDFLSGIVFAQIIDLLLCDFFYILLYCLRIDIAAESLS